MNISGRIRGSNTDQQWSLKNNVHFLCISHFGKLSLFDIIMTYVPATKANLLIPYSQTIMVTLFRGKERRDTNTMQDNVVCFHSSASLRGRGER